MRQPLRSAALVATTAADCVGMELQRLVSPASEGQAIAYDWMRRFGRAALRICGARVLSSLPPDGVLSGRGANGVGRVFVLNHRSMLDVLVYLAHFEANVLSRDDLAGWPLIGYGAKRIGTVFVNRSSRVSGSAAVSAMCRALASGRGMVVFPEGTTYPGDEVRPFRAGAFVAARRAAAEVIPVGLAYASDDACYLDETFSQHWSRLGSMREVLLAMEVGDPLPPEGSPDDLRIRSQETVQALVYKARARLNGETGSDVPSPVELGSGLG